MSDDTADELAVYDSVQRAAGASPARPRSSGSTVPSSALTVTVVMLTVLVVCSFIVLVTGLAMAQGADGARSVALTVITLGGCLLVWHLRALVAGSGRRTAAVNPWPWLGLLVTAAFGAVTGFALFDLLTGVRTASRIALLATGLVGLAVSVVTFVRDANLRDQLSRTPPTVAAAAEPEPAPPPVHFDPTGPGDALRPRGTWPQPRRGTAADSSLWDEPQFESEDPPSRARRGL